MADPQILGTITGEHFQPVRLHYHVLDQEGLRRAFQKLRCLKVDPPRQRWAWLYDHEARHLQFRQSFAQLPKHLRPIVLGSFYLRGPDKLLLDLRSCERALEAIPFFDRHIPRSAAKVIEAEIVNRLFAAAGNEDLTPEKLFDHQASVYTDPNAEVQRIMDLVANIPDSEEK